MPDWSQSPWSYDQVTWGVTPCHGHCGMKPAELLDDGIPRCIDCADELLEWRQAVEEDPRLRDALPAPGF